MKIELEYTDFPNIYRWFDGHNQTVGTTVSTVTKEFITIDIEKKFLFEFRKYPVPLFPTLPRLHPASATRRQAEILCKFYGTCVWRQVAETGCKRGTPENKGTGPWLAQSSWIRTGLVGFVGRVAKSKIFLAKLEFMGATHGSRGATPDYRDFFCCGDSPRWEEFRTLFVFVGSSFFAEICAFKVSKNALFLNIVGVRTPTYSSARSHLVNAPQLPRNKVIAWPGRALT